MADLRDAVHYITPDEAKANAFKTILLYGEYGKRKTSTAVELVKEKGLLVSSDGSWRVLIDKHPELLKKVDIVEYEAKSQLQYLKYENYDTVIFDTISKMADNYMDTILENGKWTSNKISRDVLQSKDPDLNNVAVSAFADYQVLRNKWRPVFTYLFSLPMNKIFTSHENAPIQGLTADTTIRPRMPQATYTILAEEADVIARMQGGRNGITVNVDEGSPIAVAKSRVPGLKGNKEAYEFFVEKMKEYL